MNYPTVKQELLKIVRRRKLFVTAMVLPVVIEVARFVVDLFLRSNYPGSYSAGVNYLEGSIDSVGLIGFVLATLIGAQAGAWDTANGTFRYLAMTGTPRGLLYSARAAGLFTVIPLFLLPGLLAAVAFSLVLPLEGSDPALRNFSPVGFSDITDLIWTVLLLCLVYGLISFGIGALMRSSGPAIAISLLMNLLGFQLLAGVELISPELGNVMLPQVLDRLTGVTGEGTTSLPTAVVALFSWLVVFLGAGALRTVRSEY